MDDAQADNVTLLLPVEILTVVVQAGTSINGTLRQLLSLEQSPEHAEIGLVVQPLHGGPLTMIYGINAEERQAVIRNCQHELYGQAWDALLDVHDALAPLASQLEAYREQRTRQTLDQEIQSIERDHACEQQQSTREGAS